MIKIVESLINLYIANLLPIVLIVTIITTFGFVVAKVHRDNKLALQINIVLSFITFVNYMIALAILITSIV